MTDAFAEFWADSRLPKGMKQGKGDARKAFDRAVPKKVSVEELWAGIGRLERSKPDWQAFCHLATYINQGRWEDEYEEPNPCRDMGIDERREHSRKIMADKMRIVK